MTMTSSGRVNHVTPPQNSPSVSALSRLLDGFRPAPETLVLMLAMLVGGGTGLGIVLFNLLIRLIHHLVLENLMGVLAPLGAWTLACVPVVGGVIVGLMRWRWHDFGPNLTTLVATPANLPPMPPQQPVIKSVAAAVSLGTGASLGPEGPSVEIGAKLALWLSQMLRVSHERQRLLLGAGAAAGFAAGLNAPIAGVFFALEVVLGTTFASSAVSVVLLAAVVSAWVAQLGLGGQPAFALPLYEVRSVLEMPLYVGLGILASGVSIAYVQAIQFAQTAFEGKVLGLQCLSAIPRPLLPILGGMLVGLVALLSPQVLGIGYETIEAILRDVQFSLGLLLTLLALKLVMTALSLGSGFVGGIYAPAMFLGAALGAAYGKIVALLLPATFSIAAPPAYAMVGMAAVLAGSVRAPLTAILLLFELTRDYRIVLPLMAAVGLSVWLVEYLRPPQHSLNLQQMGLNLAPNPDQAILQSLRVEQAMHRNLLILPQSLSLLETGQRLLSQCARSALVVDEQAHPIGIITLQDISRAMTHLDTSYAIWPEKWLETEDKGIPDGETLPSDYRSAALRQRLGELCTTDLVYAYRDETLAEALARMETRGLRQLPVIQRERPQQVIGLLERERIDLAKDMAITQRSLQTPHPEVQPIKTV